MEFSGALRRALHNGVREATGGEQARRQPGPGWPAGRALYPPQRRITVA